MTIEDRELDRRLDALPREVPPDQGLWPAIERRLKPDRRWPIAAAIGGLSLVALLIAVSMPEHDPDGGASLAQREAEVMRTIAPDAVAVSRTDASPSFLAAWQDNQAAIEELERALERDSDNRLLLEFLSEARLRQARLIQRGLFPPTRSI